MNSERFERGYQLRCKLKHTNETTPDQKSLDSMSQMLAEHVFGDIYSRSDLPMRDHLLVTVITIAAIGGADKMLRDHTMRAMKNGVARSTLEEIFLHMSAYCGFARAVVAKQILDSIPDETV